MTSILQDIRYCFRGFRKQPGFVAMAIVALALGIGSATAIFSVVENVLLEPFPYRQAERIFSVQVHDLQRSQPGGRGAYTTPEFLQLRRQTHTLEDMGSTISTSFVLHARALSGSKEFA